MNKKLLVLIPFLTLALTSCNGGGSEGTSSPSIIPPTPEDHGGYPCEGNKAGEITFIDEYDLGHSRILDDFEMTVFKNKIIDVCNNKLVSSHEESRVYEYNDGYEQYENYDVNYYLNGHITLRYTPQTD